MTKKTKISIFVLVAVVAIILLSTLLTSTGRLAFHYVRYHLFPSAYVVDETVIHGEYAGFVIGSSKDEVAEHLLKEYRHKAYVEEFLARDKAVLTLFQEEAQLNGLFEGSRFKIFLSQRFSDWLEFHFDEDGNLREIRRYKRDIEFP